MTLFFLATRRLKYKIFWMQLAGFVSIMIYYSTPKKTNLVVVNKRRNLHGSKVELKLDDEVIKRIHEIKYLIYTITENDRITSHIRKRKSITISLISIQGLTDATVRTSPKVLVFKSFIRSTLVYGLENANLSGNLVKEQRIEGNFIKSIIGLLNRCHTTELLQAVSILETNLYLKRLKLSFFKRLMLNELTRDLLIKIFNNRYIGCFDKEITSILDIESQSPLDKALLCSEYKLSEIRESEAYQSTYKSKHS